MIPSVTINDVRGQVMLNDLRNALIGEGRTGDAANALKDEFRLLLKQIITLTPPHGLDQSARKLGEQAVSNDLAKIFTPVDEEMINVIGSKSGVDGIDQWITGSSKREKIHLIWDKIDPTGEGMADFHESRKDSRGRARSMRTGSSVLGTWKAAYVVAIQDFKAYVQKIMSHVGRRKAAWAVAYTSIGGTVQQWIGRHLTSGAAGSISVSNDATSPSMAAFNWAPGIRDDERIVRDALRVRREAMAKRLKLILSGYSKDVAAGIRPGRRKSAAETFEKATGVSFSGLG